MSPDIVTMVTEVEAVLNSRPLTYLYPDIEDNPPLTPAHFLRGNRLTTLPNLIQDKDVDPLFIPPAAQASWSGKQELSRRIKTEFARGPGRGDTCHRSDFDET